MKEKLQKVKQTLEIYAKADDGIIELTKGFAYRGEKDANSLANKGIALIDSIIAELDSPWQPIETAPRDIEVLGCINIFTTKAGHKLGGEIQIMKRIDNPIYTEIWIKRGGDQFFPTHWMPIPAAIETKI